MGAKKSDRSGHDLTLETTAWERAAMSNIGEN